MGSETFYFQASPAQKSMFPAKLTDRLSGSAGIPRELHRKYERLGHEGLRHYQGLDRDYAPSIEFLGVL